MSPSALSDYLVGISEATHNCPDSCVTLYDEDEISEDRVYLHFRLRMGEGHLLEVRETIDFENSRLSVIDYSYHFQDPDNALIFRYDSAPHHRGLPTFPHHKHLPNAVAPSIKPTVQQVIQEAITAINPTSPATGNQR